MGIGERGGAEEESGEGGQKGFSAFFGPLIEACESQQIEIVRLLMATCVFL